MRTKTLVWSTLLVMMMPICGQAQEKATVIIDAETGTEIISKHIYGHFSEHLGHCIYDGLWVGEDSKIPNINGVRKDIIDALKHIRIPNLRWPGGCFADEYHWKNGIGPKSSRSRMVNTHWGGVVEDNSFGTHEFLNMCEELGTEPYICGNMGSGTVEEMSQWVEYITFDGESPMANLRRQNGREKPWKIRYWGVGNENWGCGGNMSAAGYAENYRRYATYCRNYSGNTLERVACGPAGEDLHWMETLFKNIPLNQLQSVSLHNYTVADWANMGSATKFTENDYIRSVFNASSMDGLLTKYSTIMDQYDPTKKVGLLVDEWGNWFSVEEGTNPGFLFQQNTMRDAITASIILNIYNKHCDRVKMANIAQLVNVLQSLIITKDEKMILTPTYHIFDMYKVHQEATLLPLNITSPKYSHSMMEVDAITATASKDAAGAIHVSMTNIDLKKPIEVTVDLRGASVKKLTSGQILTSKDIADYNSFDELNRIKIEDFKGAKYKNGCLTVNIPAKSVITLELK